MKTKTLILSLFLLSGLTAPVFGTHAQGARRAAALSTECRADNMLVTFDLVLNRGEVFAAEGLGELSSLTLSGYRIDALGETPESGAMNGCISLNSTTLTGVTSLNAYTPQPSTKTTASLRLLPLSAPTGLMLTLTVDGEPYTVALPFVTTDFRWKAGYVYVYVVTLSGGKLQVTGMQVRRAGE